MLAAITAVVFAAPIGFVVWRAVDLRSDLGSVISEARGPLWRTVQLSVLVSVTTGLLGMSLAWLLVRTDVPFARLFRVVAPLPLVFPSFVGAAAFIAGLAPDGALRTALEAIGFDAPQRFRGLGASVLVLTLFTYPYVYLPVAARLASLPPSLEESARLLGDRPARFFRRVVLPAVRGSLLGGMLIVVLYSLSEFGAVQLLGYDTLTRVVFATRLLDRAQSFAAAGLLIVLAITAVAVERRLSGSPERTIASGNRRNRPVALGRWRFPAFAFVAGALSMALVVPLVSLGQWAWRGIANSPDPMSRLGDDLARLGEPAWNTAWLAVTAGALAVLAVLPVALLSARHGSRFGRLVAASVLGGFAAPALVVALSIAFWALNVPYLDRLYQTTPLLLAAYVIHYGAQAMRSAEVAVASVPRRLGESAQLLGAGAPRRMLTVDLPLMRPGLLAGGGLVLLSTMKELPATLLLAPIGLETLTTRVWGSFENGFLAEAGLSSIVLVAASGVLTWLVVLRRAQHLA